MNICILPTGYYDLAKSAATNILNEVIERAKTQNQEQSIQEIILNELKRYEFGNDHEALIAIILFLNIAIYETISKTSAPDWLAGNVDDLHHKNPTEWVQVRANVFQSVTAITNAIGCSFWEFYKQLELVGYAYREGQKWYATKEAAGLCRYHGTQLRWLPEVGLLVHEQIRVQREERDRLMQEAIARFQAHQNSKRQVK